MTFRSWITQLPVEYITMLVTFQCVAADGCEAEFESGIGNL